MPNKLFSDYFHKYRVCPFLQVIQLFVATEHTHSPKLILDPNENETHCYIILHLLSNPNKVQAPMLVRLTNVVEMLSIDMVSVLSSSNIAVSPSLSRPYSGESTYEDPRSFHVPDSCLCDLSLVELLGKSY
jgi:hypothetical protein